MKGNKELKCAWWVGGSYEGEFVALLTLGPSDPIWRSADLRAC